MLNKKPWNWIGTVAPLATVAWVCFFSVFEAPSRQPASTEPASEGGEPITGYVEILVNPPFVPQDWSSPRRLAVTMAKAAVAIGVADQLHPKIKHSSLGHGMIHFSCANPSGSTVDEWSGYSGNFKAEGNDLVVKQKTGLAVLFHKFSAHFQESDVVEKYMEMTRKAKKRPRFIRFNVTARQCAAMTCHLNRFKSSFADPEREKNMKYGFTVDPNTYEGGGCTSYATSFIERAGLYHPIFDRWKRHLTVSEAFIGETIEEKGDTDDRRIVRIGKIFGKLGKSWTVDGYANREMDILDPQLMEKFMSDARECASGGECADPEIAEWVRVNRVVPVENAYTDGIHVQVDQLISPQWLARGLQSCSPMAQ